MLQVVHGNDRSNDDGGIWLFDEIVRAGARQMLAAALQAEVAAYIAQFADQVNEHGRRLVVRNGGHHERAVLAAAGAVCVKSPSQRPAHRPGHRRATAVLVRDPAGPGAQVPADEGGTRCCICTGSPPATSGRHLSSSPDPVPGCRRHRSPG